MKQANKMLAALCAAVLTLNGGFSVYPGDLRAAWFQAARAVNITNSGTYGGNITWELDSGGVLTLSGRGEMQENHSSQGMPWYGANIRKVSVGSGITSLCSWCFYGCRDLQGVTLPETVVSLGTGVFEFCENLSAIAVDAKNPAYCVKDGILFTGDMTGLVCCPARNPQITGVYEIPDTVRTISEYAFCDCTAPEEIIIPDSVEEIGDGAFYGCSALKKAVFPPSVKSVPMYCFSGCTSLSAEIPSHITTLSPCAFMGCRFTEIILPESLTYLDGSAFENCPLITAVFPNAACRITDIGDYFPKSAVIFGRDGSPIQEYAQKTGRAFGIIGEYSVVAAGECGEAETDDVQWKLDSDGVLTISGLGTCGALNSLSSRDFIRKIVVREGVGGIAGWAFASLKNLEEVSLPKSVAKIESGAFYYDPVLKSISVAAGNPVYRTESGILLDGTAVICCPPQNETAAYSIPAGIETIANSAFSGCGNLKALTLPEGLHTLEPYAFAGCTGLETVTLPDSVEMVSEYAFLQCTALRSITVLNPACAIYDGEPVNCAPDGAETFPEQAELRGFANSTAQAYAEKYNRTFVPLDAPQETTTTVTTTSTTTTAETTTTAAPAYKDEFFLALDVLSQKVYETEAKITSVDISDKNICICIVSEDGLYLVVQALRPGTCDITVTLENGDRYIIHLTVSGEVATTTTSAVTTETTTTTTTTTTAATTTTTPETTTTTTTTEATTTETTTTSTTAATTTTTTTEPPATTTLDRFSFTNQAKLFYDYINEQYFLTAGDYSALASRLTPCENNDVMFYLAPKNVHGGPNPQGVCYGFGLLAMMRMCGLITPADLGQGAENLRDLKLDDYLKSKIVYHYLLQITARDMINSFYDPYYTEPEKRIIGIIQDSLTAGRPVLLGYGNDQMRYHHSILAYALTEYAPGSVEESLLRQRNGEMFPAKWRVHIYDPNMQPDEDPARYDLYLSENNTWWIPKNSYGSSVPRSHLEFAIDDINFLTKASLFCTGDTAGENVKKHAYLDIRAGRGAVPSRFDQGGTIYSSGEDESGIRQIGGAWSGDDETAEDTLAYCLDFEKSDYLVDFGEGIYSTGDIRMRYPESIFRVEMEDGLHSALFSPNAVEIAARLHRPYTLSAVRNAAGEHDFHSLAVSGTSSAKLTLAECKRGWILTAGNALERLELTADDTARMTAATAANSVLIGTNSGEIGLWLDLDGNGSYETELSGLHPADTNNDGSLNLADAVASAKALAEAPGSIYPAKDTNGDGVLTVADLAKILRILQNR